MRQVILDGFNALSYLRDAEEPVSDHEVLVSPETKLEFQKNLLEKFRIVICGARAALEDKSPVKRELTKALLVWIFYRKQAWNRDMAEEMGYTITSARRWYDHPRKCPNEALWLQIFEWLDNRTEHELHALTEV